MERLVLYLHGFRSSPKSWKARALKNCMTAFGLEHSLICPEIPPEPERALKELLHIGQSLPPGSTVVGSSLGGHYAMCVAEKFGLRAVLVNPAIVEQIDPALFVGRHKSLHGDEQFDFTLEDARALRRQASGIERPCVSRYLVLVETGDEVLDYRHALERFAGCQEIVVSGGDHSFASFVDHIPRILAHAGITQGRSNPGTKS